MLNLLFERIGPKPVKICISLPPCHRKTTDVLYELEQRLRDRPERSYAYSTYSTYAARLKSRTVRQLGSELITCGVGTVLNGRDISGLMVVDDPFKNQKEADSVLHRDMVWDWFNEVVLTRMANSASIIVVQTRLHKDDLMGRLSRDSEWQIVNLPVLAEGNDPLNREPGEPLWPRRFGFEQLAEIRQRIGERSFMTLYQGQP